MSEDLFLRTVIEHYNAKGLKFTVDEVAKSLRMSKRTIYELYGNKEQITLQAVRWVFHSIKEREKEILGNDEIDLIEKIRQVICIFPSARIDFTRTEEIRVSFPIIYDEILENFENNWDNTFSIVEEAVKKGLLRPLDLEALRFTLVCVFEELLTFDVSDQREKLLQSVNLILNGYII